MYVGSGFVEGDVIDVQSGGGVVYCADLRFLFVVVVEDGGDYLCLVVKSVGELGSDRVVYEVVFQDFVLVLMVFMVEVVIGYFLGSVRFLHVVVGEREEVDSHTWGLGGGGCHQYDCLIHGVEYCSTGLFSKVTGFEVNWSGADFDVKISDVEF